MPLNFPCLFLSTPSFFAFAFQMSSVDEEQEAAADWLAGWLGAGDRGRPQQHAEMLEVTLPWWLTFVCADSPHSETHKLRGVDSTPHARPSLPCSNGSAP